MLTITGNGRLTRDPDLRTTNSGKTVANLAVASDRRNRDDEPLYINLVVWEGQAEAAAAHLVKGQSVFFSGRLDTRAYQSRDGEDRVALEVHSVDLEYGPKPRGRDEHASAEQPVAAGRQDPDDEIPF